MLSANAWNSSFLLTLAIFDIFNGQMTEEVFSMLEENNIHVVKVPANCSDRLQHMDLSVNKSVKESMRSKWYARSNWTKV